MPATQNVDENVTWVYTKEACGFNLSTLILIWQLLLEGETHWSVFFFSKGPISQNSVPGWSESSVWQKKCVENLPNEIISDDPHLSVCTWMVRKTKYSELFFSTKWKDWPRSIGARSTYSFFFELPSDYNKNEPDGFPALVELDFTIVEIIDVDDIQNVRVLVNSISQLICIVLIDWIGGRC